MLNHEIEIIHKVRVWVNEIITVKKVWIPALISLDSGDFISSFSLHVTASWEDISSTREIVLSGYLTPGISERFRTKIALNKGGGEGSGDWGRGLISEVLDLIFSVLHSKRHFLTLTRCSLFNAVHNAALWREVFGIYVVAQKWYTLQHR